MARTHKIYDWPLIKRLYTDGHTPYAIAKMDGMPTKQAIMYRAKDWQQEKQDAKELLPTVHDDSKAGKIARVIAHLRNGATHKIACLSEGVAQSTWNLWRQDPLIDAKSEQAQADYVREKAGQIDQAGQTDWKAAAWRLERHPLARDELKQRESKHEDKGLTVVLNIDRAQATVSEDGRILTVERQDDESEAGI